MYRRKYGGRRRVAKKKTASKLSKPMQRAMTQVAKKVISRRAEDKVCGSPVETDVLHNSAIGSSDCEPVIMQIPQGTDSNHRLGDRVTPKTLKVNGVVAINPEITGFSKAKDIYVRVLILQQKDLKSGAEVLTGGVDAGALLRAGYGGTGDAVQFTGTTTNLLMPVNTNLFRVYMDKQFKLDCWPEGGQGQYSRKWSYTFDKKHLPASFTFDEGNGDWPNNFAPFVAIGYGYADGTTPDTINTDVVSHVWSQLAFEDL